MPKPLFLSRRRALGALLAAAPAPLISQQQNPRLSYPPDMAGARAEVYKSAGGAELKLWMFMPEGDKGSGRRPAIVFFFGGGWTSGSPKQFEQQCRHFASRGMVAIAADYRVASRHQVKVADCVRDAKSAVRWVRANAGRLGIDPNRIAAGGGSAGGHLAAAAAILPGLEEAGEDLTVSSRANALVLFNPALVLAAVPDAGLDQSAFAKLAGRLGTEPEAVSPYHHVKRGAPPTIIFHGKADTTVPYGTVEAFARKMAAAGNRCELEGYDGQTHGFFNYGRGNNEYFEKTLKRADQFLVSLGWLK
jgi:acetyl esterase/lipase